MAEPWLTNPRKKTVRVTRKRRKKRIRRGVRPGIEMRPRVKVAGRRRAKLRPRSPLKGYRINKRRYSMARKRKIRHARKARVHHRRRRRNVMGLNPPRRRHYRRRSRRWGTRRRNPAPVMSLVQDSLWAVGGYVGTRFVGNMILPMLPVQQPLMKMLAKGAVAYFTAWGAEAMFGRRVFTPVFLGGLSDVVQDFTRTFIGGALPGLSDGMGTYVPELGYVGTYPAPVFDVGNEVEIAL